MNYLRKTFLWILLLPYALGFLGAASNQLVLIANHGKFPVMLNPRWNTEMEPDAAGMIDNVHCVMSAETHLNLLADIFNFHTSIKSVGDLLLGYGDDMTPYCWGIWLALVVPRLIRPKVFWPGTNIPMDEPYVRDQHALQTMQSATRRF